MGETAENVAEQWEISRQEQDLFAFQSQEKYFAALEAGIWEDEIAAVELMEDRLVTWFTKDEHPRKTTIENLVH